MTSSPPAPPGTNDQLSPVRSSRPGVMIDSYHDAEDRYANPTWANLSEGFATTQGGWDQIPLTAGEGQTQISGNLADPAQLQAWKDYWHQHARPIIVMKTSR